MTLEETLDSVLADPHVLQVRLELVAGKRWVTISDRYAQAHTASSRRSFMEALTIAVASRARARLPEECKRSWGGNQKMEDRNA